MKISPGLVTYTAEECALKAKAYREQGKTFDADQWMHWSLSGGVHMIHEKGSWAEKYLSPHKDEE